MKLCAISKNQRNIGITIYGKPIEPVTQFVYLAQKLSAKK